MWGPDREGVENAGWRLDDKEKGREGCMAGRARLGMAGLEWMV